MRRTEDGEPNIEVNSSLHAARKARECTGCEAVPRECDKKQQEDDTAVLRCALFRNGMCPDQKVGCNNP